MRFFCKDSPSAKRRKVSSSCGGEFCDNTVRSSKYTLLTFLPLNLFEQFHRPINLYFLVVALLQFIPSIAPVSPLSTVGPLFVAFSITAAKEGYDDFCRHRQDKSDNSRMYHRLKRTEPDNDWSACEVRSQDIRVGDIIVLKQYDMLPCDAVPLLSSNGDGTVYVSTENLDGESDAKERIGCFAESWCSARCITPAASRFETVLEDDAISYCSSEKFYIECESPNKNLGAYEAAVHVEGRESKGLTLDHFLPATGIIRNTHFVLAMAVFTGNETKVGMTKRFPPVKWALLDRECTKYAKCVFVLQFCLIFIFGTIGGLTAKDKSRQHWYLSVASDPPTTLFYCLVLPLRFFSMATLMVPISFKVTVDISKAYISKVMQWDLGAYDEGQNSFCKVNNSALAEDLGQIEYVLTDKTGTLTENRMSFRYLLTQEGHVHSTDDNTLEAISAAAKSCVPVLRLCQCLTLCNTVERAPLQSVGEESSMVTHVSNWTSPSPDEVALVEGASMCGVVLVDRTRQMATIRLWDNEEAFEVLYVIKFTSTRGRMSVLVRMPTGASLLLCKGSDERLLPLCHDDTVDRAMVSRRLGEFACKGLRTLVFAFRELHEEVVSKWLGEVRAAEAEIDTVVRTTKLGELYAQLENDMSFSGASAVEDDLQPLVRETIVTLRQASVKVWMLTGDKLETAKQIAATSGLVAPSDFLMDFVPQHAASLSSAQHVAHIRQCISDMENRPDVPSTSSTSKVHNHFSSTAEISKEFTRPDELSTQFLDTVVRAGARRQNTREGSSKSMKSEETLGLLQRDRSDLYSGNPDDYCVVVSGSTLELLSHSEYQDEYERFRKVLLGAATVICCRTTPDQKASIVSIVKSSGRMTLAIGDGGNDVAMIQEAHVGVGVEGVEGRQAAKAADFTIARFCFLRRLMLVHGHTAFQRTAYIVQQSFYKSMLIAWVQLLYNIHTLFSGVTFWNSFALTMWNGAYTIPLTFLYVTDIQLPPNILVGIPSLYQLSQKARYLNGTTFFTFVFRGALQGTLAFYLSCVCLGPNIVMGGGDTTDMQTHFIAPYGGAVVLVAFTVLLESHSFFFLQWLALLACIVAFVLSFYVYSEVFTELEFYGAFEVMLQKAAYYLVTLAVFACCYLPHCLFGGLKYWYWPSRLQLQRGFLKRISLVKRHAALRDQFPEDNPSVFLGSMVPGGCSEAAELPMSHDVKGIGR